MQNFYRDRGMHKLRFIYLLMVFIFAPLTLWAQTEEPETEVPGIVDAKAITIFGINFDLTTDQIKTVLKERFKCQDYYMKKSNGSQCIPLEGGSVVDWGLNDLGDVTAVKFSCDIFNGCDYEPEVIFSSLQERFKLVKSVEDSVELTDDICGQGPLGEQMCLFKGSKSIVLEKYKFRQKALNFD